MESRSFNRGIAGSVRLVASHGCHIDEHVEDSHSFVPGNPIERFAMKRRRTRTEFASHRYSIALTHEQSKVTDGALTSMRAPCCKQSSVATCCYPCNFAKACGGLCTFLIASHGYDADEVRYTVEEWVRFINPNGYSGDVCSTKGCTVRSSGTAAEEWTKRRSAGEREMTDESNPKEGELQ